MMLILCEVGVWDVVLRGISETSLSAAPDDSTSENRYTGAFLNLRLDTKARRLITSALTDEHLVHVISCSSAKEM